MKIKKLTILKYIFEMILLISLSLIYYLNKPIQTPRVIYIQKGSINEIIAQMKKEKYDVNKIDSLLLRFIGSPQSGWIDMGSMINTKGDFLHRITTAKAALQNITLIPGETTYVFLYQLSERLGLNVEILKEEFAKQSKISEGVFVPDTYRIPLGISEKNLMELLLNVSRLKMYAMSMKIFGTHNELKWFQYIAIASVIQKESANTMEMPLVSSVIYNRINKKMKLQMDGTLNYGEYSHIKITPQRIREDNSMYNTYKHYGVPPIPVCNVSIDAIKAAIFPAKTDYLYFMKNKKNTHDFTCNYSTHLSNISSATERNKF